MTSLDRLRLRRHGLLTASRSPLHAATSRQASVTSMWELYDLAIGRRNNLLLHSGASWVRFAGRSMVAVCYSRRLRKNEGIFRFGTPLIRQGPPDRLLTI